MSLFARAPFLIAEAGVNHNGRLDLALRLIDAAADAGADAVKFQTFKAETLASARAPKAGYQRKTTGGGSQLEMLRRLELRAEHYPKLLARCRARRVEFMSTPFDAGSADFLRRLGMRLFKLPSGELTHHALLRHVARFGKPILLSTGMSTMEEVAAAVKAIRSAGRGPLALLHCVSNYPAAPADANLRAMASMAARFKLPVGYSDHTEGTAVAIAAAALGAQVLEKHFTLDKTLPGPDHAMSLSPAELAALVRGARQAALALGDGVKRPKPAELPIRAVARRSLVLTRALPKGASLAASDLAAKRPGTGLAPFSLPKVVGRRLRRAAAADTVLTEGMLA
jgi:N,N'-diacetyllegionaminate synthase